MSPTSTATAPSTSALVAVTAPAFCRSTPVHGRTRHQMSWVVLPLIAALVVLVLAGLTTFAVFGFASHVGFGTTQSAAPPTHALTRDAPLNGAVLLDLAFQHGPAYTSPRPNGIERILDRLFSSLPPIVPEEGSGDGDVGGESSSSLAGMSVADRIGAYRDMLKIKGNYGLEDVGFPDQVDTATATALGSEWVGPDAYYSSNGKTAILSADGLREYRFPATKGHQIGDVANFEWRPSVGGSWVSNGHLTVLNLEAGSAWLVGR
jgi:hypothetical protein